MKKIIPLLFGVLLLTASLSAQSVERQIIGTAGGNNSGENVLLDWTLGETFNAYDNTLLGTYKAGYLQPIDLLEKLIEEDSDMNASSANEFSAEVFPNPFNDNFTFQLNQAREFDTQLYILDYSGKVILTKILSAGSLKIDWKMDHYPKGLYFLQFTDNTDTLRQTFKLLKM